MNNGRKKIRSSGGKTTTGLAIRSVASPQRWMMKRLGEPQWHQQKNKSKLASELAILRLRINIWLKSRNGETIGAKIKMTSVKTKKIDQAENKIKLHQKYSAFQSRNGKS